MPSTETVNLTVSRNQVQSVSKIAELISNKTVNFAAKHGVQDQFDAGKLEEDLIFFLVKNKTLRLEELEITIMEDGSAAVGGTITGRRLADLRFRINYSDGGRGF